MPGAWLTATLTRLSSPLRSGLDANMRRELGLRDAAEALHLMSLEDGAATTTSIANLPGRQSGTEAWRNARGEAGEAIVVSSKSNILPPFTWMHDWLAHMSGT